MTTVEPLPTTTSRRSRFVEEDWGAGVFRVHRDVYRDAEVFARERERVWGRGWLYLGHGSELGLPGDFKVRTVGGRPLIFLRDERGVLRVFYNSCPHRGTQVCRDEEGNAKRLRCFYHAWTFDTEGRLVSLPGADAYPEGSEFRDRLGLRPVPRVEVLREFVFISFAESGPSLAEYLGEAAEFIELVADHSGAGMRVLPGTQRYTVRANWKLAVENAMDGYHFAPSHITFLEYLQRTGYVTSDAGGRGLALAGGHVVGIQNGHSGRIGLDWEPRFGESERVRIEANREEIWARLGPERASRIADYSRTLFMFPNLLLFDIEGISIRMLEPVAPGLTDVSAWALAPVDEPEEATGLRLKTLVSFIGPGGLATPDDLEAQEAIQRAIQATA
ncbi:MAG: Rieske 2Fe-2S domain-containing protein, partial [Acidimicrobiaceae bacterium]|nr:Rieske 2Fe-2S domain-containing protein [Acidimicrobiaceae bacterium]